MLLRLSSIKRLLFARDPTELRGLSGYAIQTARLFYLSAREFRHDFCFERAASLTFASIISMIPLSVLFVGFAGLLGGGERIIEFVEEKIFQHLAPEFQKDLSQWLEEYVSPDAFRAGPTELVNLGALVGLLLAALGILTTAERVFNRIWKVRGTRSYLQKLSAFWVILTTSPFMVVASIWVEGFLVPEGGVIEKLTNAYWFVDALYNLLVPVFIGFIAFSLLYIFMPSARVNVRSAAVGALVAALLWELSKRAFYLYVLHAGAVTNFYKQLATVPLFLIWLYVTWLILLLGGEISYVHQNLTTLSDFRAAKSPRCLRFPRGLIGLYLLLRVQAAFRSGGPPLKLTEIGEELGESPDVVKPLIGRLAESGILVADIRAPDCYVLARHPATVKIQDVLRVLLETGSGKETSPISPLPAPRKGGQDQDQATAATGLEALYRRAWEAFLGTFQGVSLEDLADGVPDSGGSPGGGHCNSFDSST